MIELKGMAWDHTRGYDPMIAVSEKYSQQNPDVKVTWDKRSLKDFGDFPVEVLAETYDIIVVDHPFMAESYRQKTLVNLMDYVKEEDIRYRAKASVGKSHESYIYRDSLQAFAIDAATMVCAYRKDVLQRFSKDVPRSLNDVFELSENLPKGTWVYTTMCPTDLISLFITLFGQILGGDSYIDVDKGFDIRTGETVLDIIRKIKSISHPDSLDSNPICVLDRMSTQNDIAYSPFIFGYTNYSRQGYRDNIVLFDDAPLLPNAQCSTMLGGTGLAVSMKSRYKKEAVDYVLYATRTSIQKGIYFTCGGQPADLHAWLSPHNNEECGNFFTNTLKTLQTAFVRPKVIGWNKFQEEAGNVLNEALRGSNDNRSIVEKINALYTKLCHS